MKRHNSLVAKFTLIRILMSIVVVLDLELFQMDVKTIFLNDELKEEISTQQHKGYEIKTKENKVCRLTKSLYSLKQTSRQQYYTMVLLNMVYN